MNSIASLTPSALRKAADIQERIAKLRKDLAQILGETATATPADGAAPTRKKRKKRTMSPAARARLAAIAKARWKAAKAQGKARL
jgi:hypothetical protein